MSDPLCPQCKHPLVMHSPRRGGTCGMGKCKCKVVGITPAQKRVLDRR